MNVQPSALLGLCFQRSTCEVIGVHEGISLRLSLLQVRGFNSTRFPAGTEAADEDDDDFDEAPIAGQPGTGLVCNLLQQQMEQMKKLTDVMINYIKVWAHSLLTHSLFA